MPWDGTELWVAELDAAGRLAAERLVAGGPTESVVQPSWSPDGRLHFISDRSGWWNLYRWEDQASVPAVEGDDAAAGTLATALAPLDAEFARPAWVFGLSSYDFLHDGRVVTVWTQEGSDQLGLLTPPPGTNAAVAAPLTPIPCPFTSVASLRVLGDGVALLGGSPTQGPTIALLDPAAGGFQEVRRNSDVVIDPGYLSLPEPIAFPTWYEPGSVRGQLLEELTAAGSEDQGAGGPRLVAHALYYAPSNHDVAAPPGERPPLVVISHGGPTSAAEAVLSLDIQFWTSRGFAVVDVNYGGSTGHGRAYRERLKGNWGVVDTVDCIRAAEYLVERGDVDPARLIVRGGSAGGYTTLNALTRHRVFAAGASLFGLADLEHFVSGGTHKFESRYLLGLVGPYPEEAELYRERSPITHVDDIACPVIVLQGLEDAIVPPAQAELIVEALRRKGLPHAYLAFEGEQHGFRKAENIVRSLEAELYFYGRVFGFTPADEIAPLPTAGL
jgi:dipeptidyl aminopeptidase/acylaminoacyl peptidase